MILAIETSTPHASIAVLSGDGEDLIFETRFSSDRAHNSRIFEPLREALAAASDLQRIIVGTGPGSYSGVRVGIAVANGLAVATGADLLGVPSLGSLFASGMVVGDARRGAFFVAQVEGYRLVAAARVVSAEELTVCVADALQAGTIVATMDPTIPLDLAGIEKRTPQAKDLGRIAAAWQCANSPIEPVYIREPYITKAKAKTGLTQHQA